MGKCPSCGNSGFFLKTNNCIICDKEGCDKCMQFFLSFSNKSIFMDLWVCSDDCYSAFEKKVESGIPSKAIRLSDYLANQNFFPYELFNRTIKKIVSEKDEELAFKIVKNKLDAKWGNDYDNRFKQYYYLKQADNLERAGRREESAEIYEQYGMYDKARKLRDREKQVIVRRTDISVNLNALLQQVKDGGIVVVYRCPHCGGKLKVDKDTKVESLKVCEHCGSEIKAMELADFLGTVLP